MMSGIARWNLLRGWTIKLAVTPNQMLLDL